MLADGLDWNGLVIYASKRSQLVGSARTIEGFIEGNIDYRDFDNCSDYLIFGDDGTVLFALQTKTQKYQVVTIVGLTVLESFDSFDDLLSNAFNGHL